MHRGWFNIITAPGGRPKITRALLMRVLDYAKPYRRQIVFMLLIILITSGLGLLSPLILRDLIDRTLPQKDLKAPDFIIGRPVIHPGFQWRIKRCSKTVKCHNWRGSYLRFTGRFVFTIATHEP